MSWIYLLIVVAGSSVLASFSDWVFMGILFHDKYLSVPELWRSSAGGNEPKKILYSQIIGIISCAAFAVLCVRMDALTVEGSLVAALLVWLAGPVVVLAQMVLWTKLHPLIGVSHALGWLTRFAITGLSAAWLL